MAHRTSLRSQLYEQPGVLGTCRPPKRAYIRCQWVARQKVYRPTNGMTRHLLKGLGCSQPESAGSLDPRHLNVTKAS